MSKLDPYTYSQERRTHIRERLDSLYWEFLVEAYNDSTQARIVSLKKRIKNFSQKLSSTS